MGPKKTLYFFMVTKISIQPGKLMSHVLSSPSIFKRILTIIYTTLYVDEIYDPGETFFMPKNVTYVILNGEMSKGTFKEK